MENLNNNIGSRNLNSYNESIDVNNQGFIKRLFTDKVKHTKYATIITLVNYLACISLYIFFIISNEAHFDDITKILLITIIIFIAFLCIVGISFLFSAIKYKINIENKLAVFNQVGIYFLAFGVKVSLTMLATLIPFLYGTQSTVLQNIVNNLNLTNNAIVITFFILLLLITSLNIIFIFSYINFIKQSENTKQLITSFMMILFLCIEILLSFFAFFAFK